MSRMRVTAAQILVDCPMVVGFGGWGVLGSELPTTGEHGPSVGYQWIDPIADASKEVWVRITTQPSIGTLLMLPDSSFEYDGPSTTFAAQLAVDAADVGTPQTVTVTVGEEVLTNIVAPVTGHAVSTGYVPLVLQTNPSVITPDTGHGLGTGQVAIISQPRLILPLTGSGIASGYVPLITQDDLVVITPVTGHGVGIGYVPSISQGGVLPLTPLTGHSIARGYSPYVSVNPRRIGPQYVLYLKINT